jgi:alcohol dehydrogenase
LRAEFIVDHVEQHVLGVDGAAQLGADIVINNGREDPEAVIAELTGGLGADVTMEAVGTAQTFELAVQLVRPGGHVANIGVHGDPATPHLEDI